MSQNSKIVIQAIHEKWDIVRLSSILGKSISQTSRLLGSVKNKEWRILMKQLNWPLNLNRGHIYVGSPANNSGSFVAAERADEEYTVVNKNETTVTTLRKAVYKDDRTIKPFDHVLIERINSKYSEIFEARASILHLIYLGNPGFNKKGKRKMRVVLKVWATKREIERGIIEEIAEKYHCKRFKFSKSRRKIYKKGRSLGVSNNHFLVPVNAI